MSTRIQMENGVLRNLLLETVRFYESGGGTPQPVRRSIGPTRFGMADERAENVVLRSLLTATSHAYEEQLDAVAAAKELAAHVLASAPDAILATDMAGRLAHLNPAAEELTGWSAADGKGRPLADVLRLVDERGVAASLDFTPGLAKGRTFALRRNLRLVDRGGAAKGVKGRAMAVHGRHQRVLGMVLILRRA